MTEYKKPTLDEEKMWVENRWKDTKQKLEYDLYNVWMTFNVAGARAGLNNRLPQHYEIDIKERSTGENNSELTNYIIGISDPICIATYNKLVDEFHADWDRMVKENDEATLESFKKRAAEIIYQKSF